MSFSIHLSDELNIHNINEQLLIQIPVQKVEKPLKLTKKDHKKDKDNQEDEDHDEEDHNEEDHDEDQEEDEEEDEARDLSNPILQDHNFMMQISDSIDDFY